MLGRAFSEVLVMLVVVIHSFLFFILLLFFICCCSSFLLLFFIHCFSTSSLTLLWTIAGFLHLFYAFSPGHRKVICDTFILAFPRFSFTVLPQALRLWAFFTLGRFLPYPPSPPFYLCLSRLPWEPAVLP